MQRPVALSLMRTSSGPGMGTGTSATETWKLGPSLMTMPALQCEGMVKVGVGSVV